VALLASVRPSWLQKANRALLHELFDEVTLRQDAEFQQQVTDVALEALAPTAIRRLGADHMTAICGRRPIVALLIAGEVERRVKAGLSVPETTEIRGLRSGGELSSWLERRLNEDRLTVGGRVDEWTPARASYGLVAAAAAAAACPQVHDEIVASARAALAGADGPAPKAEDVVATLVSLGWLEVSRDTLSVAHDLVADQFIESVMLPEHDTTPDVPMTRATLAGCLTGPRAVGRFAGNIGRLTNDLALAGRAAPVLNVLDAWFTDNAAELGALMRSDSDMGGYALGAVCSGRRGRGRRCSAGSRSSRPGWTSSARI